MSAEHTCVFCRVATREKIAQIERYSASGKSVEDFLNDATEDQISTDITLLMQQHDRAKRIEDYYTTP